MHRILFLLTLTLLLVASATEAEIDDPEEVPEEPFIPPEEVIYFPYAVDETQQDINRQGDNSDIRLTENNIQKKDVPDALRKTGEFFRNAGQSIWRSVQQFTNRLKEKFAFKEETPTA